MIAGNIIAFKGEDTVRDGPLLIELTDHKALDGKCIEIAIDYGKERIYLQFRLSDLLREVKEMKAGG